MHTNTPCTSCKHFKPYCFNGEDGTCKIKFYGDLNEVTGKLRSIIYLAISARTYHRSDCSLSHIYPECPKWEPNTLTKIKRAVSRLIDKWVAL